MKTPLLSTVAACGFLLSLASLSPAQELLFDRGLPVINLNNAAGAERSNVVWSTVYPGYLVGDDFTLPGQDHYTVTTIRVWSTDSENLVLWGGPDKKSIVPVSSSFVAKPVTYANGDVFYQGYAGGEYPLFQIDFAVKLTIKGSKLFDFFLDGPTFSPYLHSSNAPRSGSPQQGADDLILFFGPEGDIYSWASSDDAWDKDSDANVQVFGTSNKKKPKPSK